MRANYRYCLIVLLFLYSCVETLPDEELTMKKTSYNGKEIRVDGYYKGSIANYNTYSNLIFYSNGVLLSFDYIKSNENKLQNFSFIENIRTRKSNWGLFQITRDTVFIQVWRLNDYIYQNIIFNYKCVIKNDTTLFRIYNNGDTTKYNFNKFSPKPDSTNVFIK